MSSFSEQNDYDFIITDIGHILERKPDPQWHIENMANTEHYILAYAISGKASYDFDNKKYEVNTGDVLFFPEGFVHSARSNPDTPWSFYSISFKVQFMNQNSQKKFDNFRNHINSPSIYKLTALLSDLNHIWSGKRTGYLIRCRSLIMEILYCIIRDTESASFNTLHFASIEHVRNMIHENYKNNYTVDELAAVSGLSPSHFRFLFSRATGLSVTKYQNYIKISKAKDFLLSGACNVTEAAFSVGFNDIYYFSRMFKKITGVNPSDYVI